MTDTTGYSESTESIRHYFNQRGHTFGGVLGQGMEGTVYDLGGDAVGKVWYRRRPEELTVLQRFYAELAASPSPIRFPEIVEVGEVDGRSATVERKLTGTTLHERLQTGTATSEQYRAVYAVVTSCVYDPQGRDGHFAWCAASLERDDILAALA